MFWDKLLYSVTGDLMNVWAILTWIFILSCFWDFLKRQTNNIILYTTSTGSECVHAYVCFMNAGWWFSLFWEIISYYCFKYVFPPSILTSLTLQLHLCLTFLLLLLFFFPFMCSLSRCLSRLRYMILTYLTVLQFLIQLCNVAVKLISKVLNFRY